MTMEIVDINKVIPINDSSSPWAVRKMKDTLTRQGQIEPLQVRKCGDKFTVFYNDPWGNEIIYAARDLGWDTLMIVEMKGYDRE